MDINASLGWMLTLIPIHWIPLFMAAWRWPLAGFRKSLASVFLFLICLLSCFVVLVCLLIFTDTNPRPFGEGHAAGWFFVYSLLTLGALPITTITAHILAGRFIGWLVRRHLARKKSD